MTKKKRESSHKKACKKRFPRKRDMIAISEILKPYESSNW